jgi:hypothetical protein
MAQINPRDLVIEILLQKSSAPGEDPIIAFITNTKTTWTELKVLDDTLKAIAHGDDIFSRVYTPEFLKTYFKDPCKLALFYRGRIYVLLTAGIVREIFWNLFGSKEAITSEKVVLIMNNLWLICYKPCPLTMVPDIVLKAFSASIDLKDFIARMEKLFLPRMEKGFRGLAKHHTVEIITTGFNDETNHVTDRQCAIRLLGSAIQLRWYSPCYHQDAFDNILDDIEKTVHEVRISGQRPRDARRSLSKKFFVLFTTR